MKKLLGSLLISIAVIATGCAGKAVNNTPKMQSEEPKENNSPQLGIARHPEPSGNVAKKLDKIPKYDPNLDEDWQVDLRGADLSDLDLSNSYSDLQFALFDSVTKWAEKLPKGFNPQKIMDLGKDPGLNIKTLHEKGINGKGVGIAILDTVLLVNHIEYNSNVKLYEEINISSDTPAKMHGAGVASIAVGKTVGVAPKSDLYFIANQHGQYVNGQFEYDFTYLAKAIYRIIEVNKSLSAQNKIRVISISVGWDKDKKGYEEITKAVEEAKKQGIFVISTCLFATYGYYFDGLGRNLLDDPNDVRSYIPGTYWEKEFYSKNNYFSNIIRARRLKVDEALLVPMDSRTTASPSGNNDYVFYRTGGWSWSVPYIAGVYALCCQVKPDITPEIFWSKALETGDTTTLKNNGKEYKFGKIINPPKLIDALKKKN